jgi:tetratricopeptide (TPR) repeat protein
VSRPTELAHPQLPARSEPDDRSRGATRGRATRRSAAHLGLAVALLGLTAAVYAPVRHYAFLNYDDPEYVTENPLVKAGLTRAGIIWAWTGIHVGNWHPLTSCSHMLDCQLFGLNPGPHHLVNVLLHVLSTLLLFRILARATMQPWPSAFVAALFALHPLHVESVAWIAERKDVLSTFFLMLALSAYLQYVRSPSGWRYILLLLAYAAALLSKPMVVTFPFVLLLLDVWPLRRLAFGRPAPAERAAALPLQAPTPTSVVIEKLPLMLMSGIASAIAVIVQMRAAAVVSLAMSPVPDRIANALLSYVIYLLQILWPAGLAAFYPFDAPLPVWQVVGAAALLVSITGLALRYARAYPYLPVGWLWYVGTLVPVIGLVRAGLQARADRFTYVPSVGIFIIAAWGVPDLLAGWKYRQAACAILSVIVIAACTVLTTFQLEHWRDSISLFQHALSVTRDNEIARQGLAGAYLAAGQRDEWRHQLAEIKRVHLIAEAADYLRILRTNPASAEAHFKLGRVRATQGDMEGARAHYAEAIRADPNAAAAHNNLGALLIAAGRFQEGLPHLEQAVRLQPDYAEAHFNLGTALLTDGRLDEAESHLTAALRIDPDYAEAHSNRGFLFFKRGQNAEAIAECLEALRIRDDFPEAHTNLATALAAEGRPAEAIAHYETALRLKPAHAAAHRGLGLVLAQQGQRGRAISELEAALRLDPGDTESQQQLQRLQDGGPGRS